MAETTQTTEITISKRPESSNNNNNPFFFLTLIPKLLLKPLQMFNKPQKIEKPVKRGAADAEAEQSYSKPPDVVRFPVKNQNEVHPIKLDEDDAPRDTNALIQWQIYALGGFIVMRWAWGKWQEWKAKNTKDSPDEGGEGEPPADDLPPADD